MLPKAPSSRYLPPLRWLLGTDTVCNLQRVKQKRAPSVCRLNRVSTQPSKYVDSGT